MKKLACTFGFILAGMSLALAGTSPKQPAGIPTPKAAESFLTPPFVSDFDAPVDFQDNWRTMDLDGDGSAWSYESHANWPALDGTSDEGGCVKASHNREKAVDDWLIMRKPVRLATGKAYVAFVYASGHRSPEEPERLAVYYGKDSAQTELLKHEAVEPWTFYGREWKFKLIEVNIESAGDYYFAIRSCSDVDRLGIYVDEIEIGQGEYKGIPNLTLDYLYLPISSCALGESEIALRLINRGKTDIESFSLAYSVNKGTSVNETFNRKIGVLDTVEVTFAQKADLSAIDNYEVRVDGTVAQSASGLAEPEKLKKDNVLTGAVRHFSEHSLPFITDMNDDEDRAQWGYAAGTWSYDPTKVLAIRAEDTLPLISRCVPLQAGHSYRFAFDYVGGIDVMGIIGMAENFEVLYGVAGTPVEGWRLIKRYENVQTNNVLASDEIVFTAETDDDYAFAIVSRTQFGVLYIQKVSVTEIMEHDVVLQDWVTRLGRLTPAQHAVKPSFEALIANRGKNDETGVKMVLKQGDRVIGGSSVEVDLKKDSLVVFRPVDGEIAKPAVNSEVTLHLSVAMAATDGNPYDNTAEFTFTATDSLYVFDQCPDNPLSGIGAVDMTLGNIFTLAEQDTLTAVVISWMDLSDQIYEDFDVVLEIFPVDMLAKTVGNPVLQYQMKRGLKGGFRTVEFPARILSAGSYLIGVRQLGTQNISIAADGDAEGYFFVAANNQYIIQADRGFLGIRAVFGTPTALKNKDIAVGEIVAPKEIGAFTARQPIRVEYANHGFETMEVEFKCTVNKTELTTKKTVKGYETGRVSFTADMSQVGTYTIVVEAVAEGDQDPDNNVAKKVVECIVIDPRVMNFEYCDDFAVSGFQPAWKSVDRDGIVPGPHNLTFPNVDSPFGFMAYNSVEAGEIDVNTGQIVNVAHSGKRCGMALVTRPENNDWLISPEFSMSKGVDSLGMMFWVCSSDPNYLEWYKVLVSTMNDSPATFTPVPDANGALLREAPGKWTKVWVDLSEYAGKNIYVAIQCVSQDAWMFFVDDITVRTGGVANEQTVDLSRYVKSYPNPATDVWTVTAYDLQINRVEIYNMTGALMFRSADNLATEAYRVHVGDFMPGLYTARVYTNAGVQTLKVIVR